jgi:hypothetical protein
MIAQSGAMAKLFASQTAIGYNIKQLLFFGRISCRA